MRVFHTTTRDKARKILKEGLKRSFSQELWPRLWFHSHRTTAHWRDMMAKAYALPLSQICTLEIEIDRRCLFEARRSTWYSECEVIQPQFIRVVL